MLKIKRAVEKQVAFPSRKYKNNSDASTGFIFIRTYNKWHSAIKRQLRDVGITHPQFVVMTVIAFLEQSEDFVTQTSVAKMADMDVMSVSQIIQRRNPVSKFSS